MAHALRHDLEAPQQQGGAKEGAHLPRTGKRASPGQTGYTRMIFAQAATPALMDTFVHHHLDLIRHYFYSLPVETNARAKALPKAMSPLPHADQEIALLFPIAPLPYPLTFVEHIRQNGPQANPERRKIHCSQWAISHTHMLRVPFHVIPRQPVHEWGLSLTTPHIKYKVFFYPIHVNR
ncbi:MAG: hypothetical protein LBB76_10480 [Azoarcus sp.]|jgi:hypothetical protein|nr:hypothetical protein [Azoarcus sp.]